MAELKTHFTVNENDPYVMFMSLVIELSEEIGLPKGKGKFFVDKHLNKYFVESKGNYIYEKDFHDLMSVFLGFRFTWIKGLVFDVENSIIHIDELSIRESVDLSNCKIKVVVKRFDVFTDVSVFGTNENIDIRSLVVNNGIDKLNIMTHSVKSINFKAMSGKIDVDFKKVGSIQTFTRPDNWHSDYGTTNEIVFKNGDFTKSKRFGMFSKDGGEINDDIVFANGKVKKRIRYSISFHDCGFKFTGELDIGRINFYRCHFIPKLTGKGDDTRSTVTFKVGNDAFKDCRIIGKAKTLTVNKPLMGMHLQGFRKLRLNGHVHNCTLENIEFIEALNKTVEMSKTNLVNIGRCEKIHFVHMKFENTLPMDLLTCGFSPKDNRDPNIRALDSFVKKDSEAWCRMFHIDKAEKADVREWAKMLDRRFEVFQMFDFLIGKEEQSWEYRELIKKAFKEEIPCLVQ